VYSSAKAFEMRQAKVEDRMRVDSCFVAQQLTDIIDSNIVVSFPCELLDSAQKARLVQAALASADNPHDVPPIKKKETSRPIGVG
jgi:hypothetical protein